MHSTDTSDISAEALAAELCALRAQSEESPVIYLDPSSPFSQSNRSEMVWDAEKASRIAQSNPRVRQAYVEQWLLAVYDEHGILISPSAHGLEGDWFVRATQPFNLTEDRRATPDFAVFYEGYLVVSAGLWRVAEDTSEGDPIVFVTQEEHMTSAKAENRAARLTELQPYQELIAAATPGWADVDLTWVSNLVDEEDAARIYFERRVFDPEDNPTAVDLTAHLLIDGEGRPLGVVSEPVITIDGAEDISLDAARRLATAVFEAILLATGSDS